jgi:hypothetical protein
MVEGVKIQILPRRPPTAALPCRVRGISSEVRYSEPDYQQGFPANPEAQSRCPASSPQDVLTDMFARAIANERLERLK